MNNILDSNADQNRALQGEELDAVSGGWFHFAVFFGRREETSSPGMNDPAQMFQQIMQQMTQGG